LAPARTQLSVHGGNPRDDYNIKQRNRAVIFAPQFASHWGASAVFPAGPEEVAHAGVDVHAHADFLAYQEMKNRASD
jgi:hypothetical protein